MVFYLLFDEMGKTDTKANLREISGIVSGVLAECQVNNAVVVQSDNIYIQANIDSTGCINVNSRDENTIYQSSSAIFSQEDIMQSVYANIVNQIVASQTSDEGGGFPTATSVAELEATITNLVTSMITASTISNYTSDYIQNNVFIQVCADAVGGSNTISGSQNDLYSTYYKMYNEMSEQQGVSASISNYLEASQEASTTGMLDGLFKLIGVIAIAIIIIVGVILVIIGVVIVKSVI